MPWLADKPHVARGYRSVAQPDALVADSDPRRCEHNVIELQVGCTAITELDERELANH